MEWKSPITQQVAKEIATKYLTEHPVAGIDGIETILSHGEPGSREPAYYYPEPIDLDKCWIAYAKPTAHRFGGSHILIISKETGKVFYSGLDGD
ncbi:MAG: hypothetical protein KKH28_05785 [Elusimicrobia bacterium]|nr:hypothetical protein [Elusimicrobiota bacterium]